VQADAYVNRASALVASTKLPLLEGQIWDMVRQAISGEVTSVKRETRDLKETLAETMLENGLLKKCMIADEGDEE